MPIPKIDFEQEICKKTELIADKFNLHIDQLGELDAQIVDTFRGIYKSSNFIDDISKRLEIDRVLATDIANEVNREVFEVWKNRMRTAAANDTNSAQAISSIERAGNFTIERDVPMETSHEMAKTTSLSQNGVNLMGKRVEPKTEPLVDQLLRGSTAIPAEKIEQKPAEAPVQAPKPPTPPKPTGPDMYREPIK